MQKSKRWIVKNTGNQNLSFIDKFGLSPVMGCLLSNREIKNEEDLQKFLRPELEDLHDPYLLPDMADAVSCIRNAIDMGEKITIFGDYDADGVTSTSVLYKFIKSLGSDVDYYIPNRFDEGYGLNIDAIEDIIKRGTQLIITVDCGVSAIEEVEYCNNAGVDIIVTDHHECGMTLPDTLVINPKRQDSCYPFKELAGVGVAYKLIQALSIEYGDIDTYEFLDLVSIGTVADIVPLLDENRVLVKYGIEAIKRTQNTGLRALADAVNLQLENINSGSIGYVLAPRINAAGRMGSASVGVELFTTSDETTAVNDAHKLCDANKYRQEIEENIFNQAQEMLKSTDDYVVVLENENWHIGVIGIVASKLVEKYSRPIVLLSRDGESCRGSARSVPGFNIYEGFCRCAELMIKYGGHEQAAGLSILHENVARFREKINSAASEMLSEVNEVPVLNIECSIDTNDISLKLADEMNILEPFGMGNYAPVFKYSSAVIDDIRTVGVQDKHLKIRLKDRENTIDAIAFNMGYNIDEYKRNDAVDIACTVSKNSWNGHEDVQLIVRDIRKPNFKNIENIYFNSLKKHIERLCSIGEADEVELYNLNIEPMDIFTVIEKAVGEKNSLIMLSSIDVLYQILEFDDIVNICFEKNDLPDRKKASAIVCPDIDLLDIDGAQNIYMLDNLIDYKTLLSNASSRGISCYACSLSTGKDMGFIKDIMPLRQDMERVYLYLKKNLKNGSIECSIDHLVRELSMGSQKLYFSMKALNELKIFNMSLAENGIIMVKFNPYNKNPMENSRTVNMFESIMHSLDSLNIILRNMRGKS